MIDQQCPHDKVQQLNRALEALHFGFRALTAQPDETLKSLGYSRVHHRILYFIGQNPGCSVNEVLGIMRVSKQYLNRPLRQLIEDGYVLAKQDRKDKRIKRLTLARKGGRLEEALTGEQRGQLAAVFEKAGPQAEDGWRQVMLLLANPGNLSEGP